MESDGDGFFKVCDMALHRDDILYHLMNLYPDIEESKLQEIVNNIDDDDMVDMAHYMDRAVEYQEAWYYAFDYAFGEVMSGKFNELEDA